MYINTNLIDKRRCAASNFNHTSQITLISRQNSPRQWDYHIGAQVHQVNSRHWNKLGELKGLIPVYKACDPAYEHVLANQNINLDLQYTASNSNQHLQHPPAQHPPAQQIPPSQQIQSNNMAWIFSERPRQVQNLYWQSGHPVGAPFSRFRQVKYLPLPIAVPDLDQAFDWSQSGLRTRPTQTTH